jgi:hypothetical protein
MINPPRSSGIPMDPEDNRYALSFLLEEAEVAKSFFEDHGYVVSDNCDAYL